MNCVFDMCLSVLFLYCVRSYHHALMNPAIFVSLISGMSQSLHSFFFSCTYFTCTGACVFIQSIAILLQSSIVNMPGRDDSRLESISQCVTSFGHA